MNKLFNTTARTVALWFGDIFQNEKECNTIPSLCVLFSEEYGNYLTDPKKRTLYYSKEDVAGTENSAAVSLCEGSCLIVWQIFYENKIVIPKPLTRSDISVLVRQDGRKQICYKGCPLYYYINDTNPLDIKGEGFGNIYSIVKIS